MFSAKIPKVLVEKTIINMENVANEVKTDMNKEKPTPPVRLQKELNKHLVIKLGE